MRRTGLPIHSDARAQWRTPFGGTAPIISPGPGRTVGGPQSPAPLVCQLVPGARARPFPGPAPARERRGKWPEPWGPSPETRPSQTRCRLVPEPRGRNPAAAVAHPAWRIPGPLVRQRIVPAPLEPPSAPTPRTGERRRAPLLLVPADAPRQSDQHGTFRWNAWASVSRRLATSATSARVRRITRIVNPDVRHGLHRNSHWVVRCGLPASSIVA
jgi:hypothetical protein